MGCGDSLVTVERSLPDGQDMSTQQKIMAALEELFAIDQQYLDENDLYSAFYQSDLGIDAVDVDRGTARVWLSGSYALGGACDIPRFKTQLERTVGQFSDVDEVEIYIDGQILDDALSARE